MIFRNSVRVPVSFSCRRVQELSGPSMLWPKEKAHFAGSLLVGWVCGETSHFFSLVRRRAHFPIWRPDTTELSADGELTVRVYLKARHPASVSSTLEALFFSYQRWKDIWLTSEAALAFTRLVLILEIYLAPLHLIMVRKFIFFSQCRHLFYCIVCQIV